MIRIGIRIAKKVGEDKIIKKIKWRLMNHVEGEKKIKVRTVIKK